MKNNLLNKTSVLFLFTIVIFLGLNINVINAQSSYCNPDIQIVNQDPNPAVPDSYVKVVIQISSLQGCNGFAVSLKPEYPFSVDPGTDITNNIASSPNAAFYSSVWDVPYKIRIASDAIEGDYNLKLLYHEGNSKDFSSNFVSKNLNLSIVDSQTSFDAVFQAYSSGQVSLGIVNTGKNTANSLVVSVPAQESFRVTGATDQIIGNLAAGDYTIVSFSLTPRVSRNNTAGSGMGVPSSGGTYTGGQNNNPDSVQVLKVKLDYTDGIGKRRSVIKEVSIGNSVFQSGNFTGTFNRSGIRNSSSSSTSIFLKWYFYAIIIFILIIGYVFYRKRYSIKSFLMKHGVEKNLSHTPEWVTAEKGHKKK